MQPSDLEQYRTPWKGIGYPPEFESDDARIAWKAKNCRKGRHLLCEVLSTEHYLYCDACGLTVHIAAIEPELEAVKRARTGKPTPWMVVARPKGTP